MRTATFTANVKWEIRKPSLDCYEAIGTWLEDGTRMTNGEHRTVCDTLREARSALKALRKELGDSVTYTRVEC